MLYHKYKPLASRVYCTGLALLLVLSEVFSSNVQDTLPGFSRIMRLGLTGCAVLLLAGKIILLTGYEARWQKVLIAVVLVYTAFSSWYGGDLWFFLAALIGLGAKDVDWETALRVYLVTADGRAGAGASATLCHTADALQILLPQLGFRLRPLQRLWRAACRCVFCLGVAAA